MSACCIGFVLEIQWGPTATLKLLTLYVKSDNLVKLKIMCSHGRESSFGSDIVRNLDVNMLEQVWDSHACPGVELTTIGSKPALPVIILCECAVHRFASRSHPACPSMVIVMWSSNETLHAPFHRTHCR